MSNWKEKFTSMSDSLKATAGEFSDKVSDASKNLVSAGKEHITELTERTVDYWNDIDWSNLVSLESNQERFHHYYTASSEKLVSYYRSALEVDKSTADMIKDVRQKLPVPAKTFDDIFDQCKHEAILSAPGSHNVAANNDDAGGGGATLLLYLDPHQSQVTGAVTLNTLATENGAATDTDTLKQTGETILGDIKTRESRNFEIRGFVTTSQGRIDSRVDQVDDFDSTQAFHLEGPQYPPVPPIADEGVPTHKLYDQHIWLTNSVQQTSTRAIGAKVISWDQTHTEYPLDLLYRIATIMTNEGDGFLIDTQSINVTVNQGRVVDGDHYQSGPGPFSGHFATHAASAYYSVDRAGVAEPHPLQQSSTTRDYSDNVGSCYRADMNSANGAITGREEGNGCPGGHDWVIWFAHPDGSPDNLDWQH